MTSFCFSDGELERTISYIKDDKYIASLYGCSIHRIRRLRQKLNQQEDKRAEAAAQKDNTVYFWAEGDARYRADMQRGSNLLYKSLITFFREREKMMGQS